MMLPTDGSAQAAAPAVASLACSSLTHSELLLLWLSRARVRGGICRQVAGASRTGEGPIRKSHVVYIVLAGRAVSFAGDFWPGRPGR